ncbi:PGDYG domain-containing protein [Pelomonas cellulosilytica]|uniref:PGDYG domain-containing protein n=1 Tax=Pelomonas cellulosilytica TaxID=2906762 RepID=A0ABS8XY89_9BURK|nr:PGDYG domain-containing protein [Pelomonas sp. P8]MCE4555704.1 PGDYG domain-containing protein [Pelomonas sp. P8]
MARYLSRPRTLWATLAGAAGVVQTLEGPVRHEAGDAILTGLHGEQWPVPRASFALKYRPVEPERAGHSGYYAHVAEPVDAVQAAAPSTVQVQGGTLKAQPGDWIVSYPDGSRSVVRADLFARLYQPDTSGPVRALQRGVDEIAFEAPLREALARDLKTLAWVCGRETPSLVVFVAARCLERVVLATQDAAAGRAQSTVQQRIDLLQLTGAMTSGEAAVAHNLRRLGNQVRHLDDALGPADEPFVLSLLCAVLGWAAAWWRAGPSRDDGDTQAARERIEAAAPVPEVLTLAHARRAADCAQCFTAIAQRVHANAEFLLLFAVERSLDFGELDIAERLLALVRAESGIRSRRTAQLRALTASRAGDLRRARELVDRYLDREPRGTDDRLFEESQGIKGGVYKRCWARGGSREDLVLAHRAYEAAWSRGGSFYSGINCAATLAWLGRTAEARGIALALREELAPYIDDSEDAEVDMQAVPWLYASHAEACLLAGDMQAFTSLAARLKTALASTQRGVWTSFSQQLAVHEAQGVLPVGSREGGAV